MKTYDKEKFVSDSIRVTPEELRIYAKRVKNVEERRVFGMVAMQIRMALQKQGITQTGFAKMLGVDPSVVTRYLSGKHNFQLRTLVKVQEILGIEIVNNWYFLNRNRAEEPKPKVNLFIGINMVTSKERYVATGVGTSTSVNTFSKTVENEQQLEYYDQNF